MLVARRLAGAACDANARERQRTVGTRAPGFETRPVDVALLKHADILAAVESLYDDRVKPWGRILRKRLMEMHMAKLGMDKQDPRAQAFLKYMFRETQRLEAVCRKNNKLLVLTDEAGEAGDWSVELYDRRCDFIDAQSPVDVYPAEMWKAAQAFFEDEKQVDLILPRSRYDCAQTLLGMQVSFLRDSTLGEACHIVQLCISQKKLLGQKKGGLVPYSLSESKAKEQRAAELQEEDQDPFAQTATWETLAAGLTLLLADHEYIPLATLKQHFDGTQAAKLNETALGYSKLSELLQDSRLQGVCKLLLDSKGYFVVPPYDTRSSREPSKSLVPGAGTPPESLLKPATSTMKVVEDACALEPMKIPSHEDVQPIKAPDVEEPLYVDIGMPHTMETQELRTSRQPFHWAQTLLHYSRHTSCIELISV